MAMSVLLTYVMGLEGASWVISDCDDGDPVR